MLPAGSAQEIKPEEPHWRTFLGCGSAETKNKERGHSLDSLEHRRIESNRRSPRGTTFGCGSIFWCGTFRGDADVWNESVTQGRLFRTSGRTCVESSRTRSFSVRWIDGSRKKRSYLHGACVCMWTWWQIAPLRLEHVWNGSGTGSGTVTRVARTLEC